MVSISTLVRTVDEAAAEPGDGFDLVTFRRRGKPPLRARCRCLISHKAEDADLPLSVSLWERKDGRLVIAYDGPGPDGIGSDAAVVATSDEACRHLEDECRGLTVWTESASKGFWGEPLSGFFARAEAGREFRILVGEALAAWPPSFTQAPATPS